MQRKQFFLRKANSPLRRHIPQEQHVPDDVPPPHPPWLLYQPVQPFQAMLLPPQRRPLHRSGKEVEHRPDRSAVAADVQLLPVAVRPFLLLRCRHPYPQQVRLGLVDGVHDVPVLLLAECRLVGRRVRLDANVRIHLGRLLPYQGQHLLTASHEEARAPRRFSRSISKVKRSHPAMRSCGWHTMLAPSGISASPFISASANSGSFSAVLYECALMVLMRSLPSGRRSSSLRLQTSCISLSLNFFLSTIYILYLIFYIGDSCVRFVSVSPWLSRTRFCPTP